MIISYVNDGSGEIKQAELDKDDCVCTLPVEVHKGEKVRIKLCPCNMPADADSYYITGQKVGYNAVMYPATRDGDCIYADMMFCAEGHYKIHAGYTDNSKSYVVTGIHTINVTTPLL